MTLVLPSLAGARRVADGSDLRRAEFTRLTRAQLDYLEDDRQIVLVRGGNQIGKTTAMLIDLIARCRGAHPHQKLRHKPPINAIVVSESWDQMGQVGGFMSKLWALLPKDEIDPRNSYDPGRGITGKPPRIVFTSGPGKGSAITFATYQQGAARVAGSTVHLVVMDEPGPPSLFVELVPRLFRHGGLMRVNFTPTLDMPDQTELRKLVRAGKIAEHNPHLAEVNCWPIGAPRPWKTSRELRSLIELWPESLLGMRLRGDWEPVYTGNALSAFDRTRHIRGDSPPEVAALGVGIDHGAQAGKQAASLTAVAEGDSLEPYVWQWAEHLGDGRTSTRDDARGILGMLKSRGQSWENVDVWVGDRPTSADRNLIVKDNAKLRQALASEAGVPLDRFPVIETADKRPGSVDSGLAKWNAIAATYDGDGTPHLTVHPDCTHTVAFASQWEPGDNQSPLKNMGDAARYVLNRMVAQDLGSPSRTFRYT